MATTEHLGMAELLVEYRRIGHSCLGLAAGFPLWVTTISSSRSSTPVINSGNRALTSEIGMVRVIRSPLS